MADNATSTVMAMSATGAFLLGYARVANALCTLPCSATGRVKVRAPCGTKIKSHVAYVYAELLQRVKYITQRQLPKHKHYT